MKKNQKVAYLYPDNGEKCEYICRCGATQCRTGGEYIVDTGHGQVVGKALKVMSQEEYDQENPGNKKLKARLVRELRESDSKKLEQNKDCEEKAYQACQKKISVHKLPMKLVKVHAIFDNSKLVFYFISENRVDFRDLVKELASEFRTRIEMKQIGVRDEARLLGGHGSCGRELCCKGFLKEFAPVSIKMAKAQNLGLEQVKISGICNRLMCCLNYEYKQYDVIRKKMPRVGSEFLFGKNKQAGKVVALDILSEEVSFHLVGEQVSTLSLAEFKKNAQFCKQQGNSGAGNRSRKDQTPRRRPKKNKSLPKQAPSSDG